MVDSLFAVRELVFARRQVTLEELARQVAADFPDDTLRLECRALPGKYGTDTPATNALVRDLSRYVADLVLNSRLNHGVQPYPAFFWFMVDIRGKHPATPDGRRSGERVSYGAGPSELSGARSPTAILNSAAHVAHDLCACGTPLSLSLAPGDVRGEAGRRRVLELVRSYFRQGGFHLHVNVVDAALLREAKRDPQAYPDLAVRVSGYSARFSTLDEVLQDAIIQRTELGM